MSVYTELKAALQVAADLAGGVLQIALGTPEDSFGRPIFVFYPPPPEENGRDLQAGALWEPESAIDLIVQKVADLLERAKVTADDASVGYLYDKITVGAGLTKTVEDDGFGNKTLKIGLSGP